VAEAIEDISGSDARLKWPNDVWLGSDPDNAKVAGVLVTSSLRGNAVDHA
jgi:biotin-(acetyl-CoA carboxylase) ligase